MPVNGSIKFQFLAAVFLLAIGPVKAFGFTWGQNQIAPFPHFCESILSSDQQTDTIAVNKLRSIRGRFERQLLPVNGNSKLLKSEIERSVVWMQDRINTMLTRITDPEFRFGFMGHQDPKIQEQYMQRDRANLIEATKLVKLELDTLAKSRSIGMKRFAGLAEKVVLLLSAGNLVDNETRISLREFVENPKVKYVSSRYSTFPTTENTVFYPTYIILPVVGDLSVTEITELMALGIHPLGLTDQKIAVDGRLRDPFDFFQHDLNHYRIMYELRKNTRDELRYDFTRSMSLHRAAQTAILAIDDPFVRDLTWLMWFETYHEHGITYTASAGLNFVRDALETPFPFAIQGFMKATNDPVYFGPLFPNRKPTETEVRKAFAWIAKFLEHYNREHFYPGNLPFPGF
jgi:hypothetical protein